MAGFLDYGVGAFNGNRILRADRLKDAEEKRAQAKLDEEIRSNMATEDYRSKALDENTQYRILQQDMLNDSRLRADEDRNQNRALRTIEMTPIGGVVQPKDYDTAVSAGVPASIFNVREIGGHLGDGTPESDQGPTIDRQITNLGTQTQRFNEQRIKDAELNANRVDADRDAARVQSLMLRWFQPTPVQLPDGSVGFAARPEVAGAVMPPELKAYLSRNNIRTDLDASGPPPGGGVSASPAAVGGAGGPGAGGGFRAPNPSPIRQEVMNDADSIRYAREILQLGKDTHWGGVGPVDGGVGGFATSIGVSPDSALINNPIVDSGGVQGQVLRNKIKELFSTGVFAQGGKNLTNTEKSLLESFRATVNTDPLTAQTALETLVASMERRMGSLGAVPPADKTPATKLPDVPPGPAGETVFDRLNRRRAAAQGQS